MFSCGECSAHLPAEGDFVTCYRCDRKMHFGCTTISERSYRKMTLAKKEEWRCGMCRKENQNVASPTQPAPKRLRSPISPKGIVPVAAPVNNDNNTAVLYEMKTLRNEMADIKSSCEFVAHKYEQINQHMLNNNDLLKKLSDEIKELKESNARKDQQILLMESKVNTLEQQLLKNNIEVKNIPPTTNENLTEVIQAIGKTINCVIEATDIADIYRTNKRNAIKSSIIVSFTSYARKANFVKKAKLQRRVQLSRVRENLQNNEVSRETQGDAVVFVNNHLTPTNKHLLWLAKNKARECSWRFVWETAGKVFARREENTDSIHISSASDVSKILM